LPPIGRSPVKVTRTANEKKTMMVFISSSFYKICDDNASTSSTVFAMGLPNTRCPSSWTKTLSSIRIHR
jgi:hypothetical protein